MNYPRAIKELRGINKLHNKGKRLFLQELKSAETVDDLKRIMENHLTVFFDEMNFMFSLSTSSLQLISDISKKSKTNQIDDFTEGKVSKTMNGIVDEVKKFRGEMQKKHIKGK